MKIKRKLRLEPEALRVETFPTEADGKSPRGTVQGHDSLTGDPTQSWSGPVNCFCCGTQYDSDCCWTDPIKC